MKSEKLMLVDGNSILNRAFYGLQGAKLLATSDGLFTNAVFGFINILYKYLEEEKPQYLCVAFDLKAPTFRHKEFENYKAQRKGMPGELAVQVPVIKEVLDAMNIKRLENEGFEADDIIGTVSLMGENKGMEVVIITGDRDALQLASQTTRIKIPKTKAGKTETEEYDFDKMLEVYGVTPIEFIDVKGLMGDTSDNIPGVPGIGEKTAIGLIKKFGSIEKVYENVEEIDKNSVREKIKANKDSAFLSKRLATIERNMPPICSIEELKRGEFDKGKLYQLFKRLEFKSFIDKFKLSDSVKEITTILREQPLLVEVPEELENVIHRITQHKEFSLLYLLDKNNSFHEKLAGISVYIHGNAQDAKLFYIALGDTLSEDLVLTRFKHIFEDNGIKKSGHDMKDFITYLKRKGIGFSGLNFDTMVGAYIINPSSTTYTVPELASQYMDVTVESIDDLAGKGKKRLDYGDIPKASLAPLAGTYAKVIHQSAEILDSLLKKNNQEDLYYQIELPLVEVLADMEFYGFKVDVGVLNKFSKELEQKIADLESTIYELAGEVFNINSTRQLGSILFDKLGLPVIKKTKTGYSTDAEVLEELSSQHEIIEKILEYRQLVKLKSTYVEGLIAVIHPQTGKIHSSFNQTVTVTGRISSTEPNLQNIPIKLEMGRKIRKVFVPSDDSFLLLDADYSQIELRVLAHITGDENMLEAFLNNEDIHTTTASKVFGVEKQEVSSLMRARAKAVNFGIVYGIGEFSLGKDLGITRKQARKYIDEYLDKYPNVKKYMHDIVAEGKEQGFVTTLFNRRRYLPELKSSNFNMRSFGERIAMNTPIQGSAADIIKIAMVKVYQQLKKNNLRSRLILQVHDELIIEAYTTELDVVARIMKDCMENAIKLAVPLSVEVKSGHNWYETK